MEITIPQSAAILALNSGSSSLKLSLYEFRSGTIARLAVGEAEEIGSNKGRVKLSTDRSVLVDKSGGLESAEQAAKFLLDVLKQKGFAAPDIVGHRIVHGGPGLREHQLITPEVLQMLDEAVLFAPLHLPPSLEVVRHTIERFAGVPQVACFDTAFHRTLPEHAARLPFSTEYWDKGLRRYGFHGLSFESIVHTLGPELPSKLLVAHLGNGCSLCAIRDGKSVDTSMGLTPTGGVIMGSRSGDLDPGVLLHLLRVERYSGEQLDELVNHRSGLRGVSGTTNDMRQLLTASATDKAAALAVEMFCYEIAKFIGAMAAALNGIETLVFTAGIGEHAAPVRSKICSRLEHLGIVLDESANQRNADVISANLSKCRVRVIATDEDLQIARHCIDLRPAQHQFK